MRLFAALCALAISASTALAQRHYDPYPPIYQPPIYGQTINVGNTQFHYFSNGLQGHTTTIGAHRFGHFNNGATYQSYPVGRGYRVYQYNPGFYRIRY